MPAYDIISREDYLQDREGEFKLYTWPLTLTQAHANVTSPNPNSNTKLTLI